MTFLLGPASSFKAPKREICLTFKSLLASVLALACFLAFGTDLPASLAVPPENKKTKTQKDASLKGLPITELSAEESVLHALNRLGYGPRPGDVERVRQMGLAKWIEQQLNPAWTDDSRMEARLQRYPTLSMPSAKLIAEYPQPQKAAQQAGQMKSVVKHVQTEKRRSDSPVEIVKQDPESSPNNQPTPQAAGPSVPPTKPGGYGNMPPATGGEKRDFLGGREPNNIPRVVEDESKKPPRIVAELAMAKFLRATYSERQLEQVLDDFWFNHFNVFAGKGEDRYYLTAYERDVIQPRVLGKFKDLVRATSKSPAMLFYLDNFLSADPRAGERLANEGAWRQQKRRGRFGSRWPPRVPTDRQAQHKKNERGLNENYGRELMELHTLGVDGGYTQKDVTEVARCFTGWTIEKPRMNPEFKFDERLHDPTPKLVLGRKIHAGGMKDGEQVIDMLSRHPSTAKFISTKLARRFVADRPPKALVDRMANTFQSTDGDIKAVLRTMIWSPEFWSREAYRAKIKTPFELVVSATRALGTDVDTPQPLVQWVARIGEPLYQCQPPTGYSDKAETWVNTGALLNRLNFSLAVAGNKVRGARTDIGSLFGLEAQANPKTALERAVQVFLGGQAGPSTLETLQKQLENPQVIQAKLDDPQDQVDLGVVSGLVLGAPEFQRK
jgi:uncharacterized protein (DUF1800 family)